MNCQFRKGFENKMMMSRRGEMIKNFGEVFRMGSMLEKLSKQVPLCGKSFNK